MNVKLLFLISQPRAGSTLIQRILGGHPEIFTFSEPWIMLHPIYAFKDEGTEAEYNAGMARAALYDFIDILPEKIAHYHEAIRRMYGFLYQQAAAGAGKNWFLDKTPRYYLIISELFHIFPDAKFIFLFRNPMEVLDSIMRTWVKDDWFRIHAFKSDLLDAPRMIQQGIKVVGNNGYTVRYDDLTRHPEDAICNILDWLQIPRHEGMIQYGGFRSADWRLGDQKNIHYFNQPVQEPSGKWDNMLANPQYWRIADDYCHALGSNTFDRMGYSSSEIEKKIQDHRPPGYLRINMASLSWLAAKRPENRSLREFWRLRFIKLLLLTQSGL